jgi:hypothetical protein
MKTAIQEAIEKLQEESRAVFGEFMKDDGTKENELVSESNGLLTAIRICKALLPKEREQIEQAFTSGEFNNYEDDDGMCISPEEYYLKTFKQ